MYCKLNKLLLIEFVLRIITVFNDLIEQRQKIELKKKEAVTLTETTVVINDYIAVSFVI